MWRESLKDLSTAIRAHPRFDEAAHRFVRDIVAWRIRLGVLNKVVSNQGRERIVMHLLYLHYAKDLDPPGHGATFERLAALSDEREGFGARAVRTALRLAQIGGLIAAVRSRDDGRLRIFEPTELLLALMRENYAIHFSVFEKLLPDFRIAARLRQESGLLPELLSRAGRVYLAVKPPPRSTIDPFAELLRLEGGRAIVSMLVESHGGHRDFPMTQDLAQRTYFNEPGPRHTEIRADAWTYPFEKAWRRFGRVRAHGGISAILLSLSGVFRPIRPRSRSPTSAGRSRRGMRRAGSLRAPRRPPLFAPRAMVNIYIL